MEAVYLGTSAVVSPNCEVVFESWGFKSLRESSSCYAWVCTEAVGFQRNYAKYANAHAVADIPIFLELSVLLVIAISLRSAEVRPFSLLAFIRLSNINAMNSMNCIWVFWASAFISKLVASLTGWPCSHVARSPFCISELDIFLKLEQDFVIHINIKVLHYSTNLWYVISWVLRFLTYVVVVASVDGYHRKTFSRMHQMFHQSVSLDGKNFSLGSHRCVLKSRESLLHWSISSLCLWNYNRMLSVLSRLVEIILLKSSILLSTLKSKCFSLFFQPVVCIFMSLRFSVVRCSFSGRIWTCVSIFSLIWAANSNSLADLSRPTSWLFSLFKIVCALGSVVRESAKVDLLWRDVSVNVVHACSRPESCVCLPFAVVVHSLSLSHVVSWSSCREERMHRDSKSRRHLSFAPNTLSFY